MNVSSIIIEKKKMPDTKSKYEIKWVYLYEDLN